MGITTNYHPAMFDAKRNFDAIKAAIVRNDLPAALKIGQSKGFPTDPEDYQLFVKTGGREVRRQLSTISPDYIKIGSTTRPTEFRFEAKSGGDIMPIVRAAYALAVKRAPVRTGRYQGAMTVIDAGGGQLTYGGLNGTSEEEQHYYVTNAAAYASIIEAGFYRKRYKTQKLPQGILYWVAQQIRREYSGQASVRFVYISGGLPAVEIGPPGAFPGLDKTPGRAAYKRARKAAKARRRRAARKRR